MKKIFFTLITVAFSYLAFAQNCGQAVVTTDPAVFTAEDEVKLMVDVSGCPALMSQSDIYLWMFIPDGPGPDGVGGNGDFCGGSNPKLKMTKEGDGKYSFVFTPTELFNTTAAGIGSRIGIIPKAFAACKTAGDQTVDLFLPVDPLVFVEKENRVFPSNIVADDIVTIYFNKNLATNEAMKSVSEFYVYTGVNGTDASGNDFGFVEKTSWGEVGNKAELKMKDEGNGKYSLTFIPNQFFPINNGDKIKAINYKFRNKDGSVAIPSGFDNFIQIVEEAE